jgi:hypothetical protein
MKIAILFSGRIQRYKEHYENIMFAIGQVEADHRMSPVENNSPDFFLSHSPECEEDLDDFIRLYKPKTVNNNPIHYLDASSYTCHPQSNSHNMMCMWVNRKRVFEDMCKYMQENDVWYDLIISTRLDLWCYQCLDYTNVLNPDRMTFKDIYVPESQDWGGLNDQMAVGTFYAMETYMTLYDNMKEIIERLMITNGTYGPEPVLKTHMDMSAMRVHRFPLDYRLINGKMYHSP